MKLLKAHSDLLQHGKVSGLQLEALKQQQQLLLQGVEGQLKQLLEPQQGSRRAAAEREEEALVLAGADAADSCRMATWQNDSWTQPLA